ncbi:hypothetical protein B0I35DRAFT_355786 [Stachybotrys elegans]|uniref:Glucose-methanol-choline oxidoreductase N-terminal domain-containing protein n=1 Tax=Stachybotrys elegans TaxID=80388 RepID=A0A8K0STL8_9HYPO|nr:hypothetical protein B0I35DRAFT_355786 [Stachybotrys elegans]
MEASYDFVIVGGGTAGLTLAARLSEDASVSVAVIEAGTYYQIGNPLLSSTPLGACAFIGTSPDDCNPAVDWSITTTPQKGASNRQLHYPRGKCLGGSSGRNFMMYIRPCAGSLQKWADMVDDQSFTFDKMLPYFQKSCTFTPQILRAGLLTLHPKSFKSEGGPLHVSYYNNVRPFSVHLESAFNEIGVPTTQDFNSGDLLGAQYCTNTVDPRTATRSSSQTAFLDLCQARHNIKVFQNTMAKKIIFDDNKRARSIIVDSGLCVKANREIILSAGAFQSPQLLMVSGVGPAKTLDKFNIPVIADRPGVGRNMEDHVMYGPSYRTKLDTILSETSDPAKAMSNLIEYFSKARGPLSHSGTDFVAWEKLPRGLLSEKAKAVLAELPDTFPDIEYMSMDAYYGDYASPMFKGAPKDGHNYVTVLVAPMALRSRGSVTIQSSDMADLPLVDPNWLTDPVDQEVAVAGFKRARQLFASNALKGTLVDQVEYHPGPSVETDQQILEHIRSTLSALFHASVTCRMGKPNDPTAVVDTGGLVYGVSGLRIVDTSSFAMLPSGHPQSMVYAFAEKVADEIKALYM